MTADQIVGEQVLLAIHRRKTTRRALAQVLRVSEASVGRKIDAQSTFTLDELLLLARHFDMPITDLLPGEDYEPMPSGRGRKSDASDGVRHQGLEPRTRWFGARSTSSHHPSHLRNVATVLPFRVPSPSESLRHAG